MKWRKILEIRFWFSKFIFRRSANSSQYLSANYNFEHLTVAHHTILIQKYKCIMYKIQSLSSFEHSLRMSSSGKKKKKHNNYQRQVTKFFSKNYWKPKLTDEFGCIICNQQKDCASVETSLATVHARAQEMGKKK